MYNFSDPAYMGFGAAFSVKNQLYGFGGVWGNVDKLGETGASVLGVILGDGGGWVDIMVAHGRVTPHIYVNGR